jgi:hypothetical protein
MLLQRKKKFCNFAARKPGCALCGKNFDSVASLHRHFQELTHRRRIELMSREYLACDVCKDDSVPTRSFQEHIWSTK